MRTVITLRPTSTFFFFFNLNMQVKYAQQGLLQLLEFLNNLLSSRSNISKYKNARI